MIYASYAFLAFSVKETLTKWCTDVIESLSHIEFFKDTAFDFNNLVTIATGTGAFQGLRVAGEALLVLYFLINMTNSAIKDRHDSEALIKEFALLS